MKTYIITCREGGKWNDYKNDFIFYNPIFKATAFQSIEDAKKKLQDILEIAQKETWTEAHIETIKITLNLE